MHTQPRGPHRPLHVLRARVFHDTDVPRRRGVAMSAGRPLDVGRAVRHAVFGLGATLSSDASRTTIEFVDHGTKTFVTAMLEVELTDEALPHRIARRVNRKSSN